MSKNVYISANFMRKHKFFMSKLTPQQQKLWFAPYLALVERNDVEINEIISVSLDEIRDFLGSKQQNKELKRTIENSFKEYKKLYVCGQAEPFKYIGVEKGRAYFKVYDYFVVINPRERGMQYYKIDLDEIASYKNTHSQKSRTIPLLWYCLSHRHWSKEHDCWEVSFSDTQIKEVCGLGWSAYLYIPTENREFYSEVSEALYGSIGTNKKYVEYLLQKYSIATLTDIYQKYDDISELVSFKRWDFEQKVLLPAITELNKGTMINFRLQDVLKRSPKGEKATWVKSYIGKNYTKLDDNKYVILQNGSVIDRNITDFTKLQAGKQYTFLIEK